MPVAILTSKVGYGTYIPAVYIHNYLKHTANFYCIEDYISLEEKQKFQKKVTLAKRNPRIAEICSYMPDETYDDSILTYSEQILYEWYKQRTDKFICFSGKWRCILNSYCDISSSFSVVCIIMDFTPSIIWKEMQQNAKYDLHFENVLGNEVILLLKDYKAYPYPNRSDIISWHGGGWALINENSASLLKYAGFSHVSILVPKGKEIKSENTEIHEFCCDFDGRFPYEIIRGKNTPSFSLIHPSLELIAQTRCLITKPGGMAIMDSIMSETPIIFDKITIGEHETSNREWALSKGIALNIEELSKENINNGILDFLHCNILKLKQKSILLENKLLYENQI